MGMRAAGFVIVHGSGTDRRYLLLRNARHGTWGFPKGHQDGAESDIGTAVRELVEETGIRRFRPLPGFRRAIDYRLPDGDAKTTIYYVARVEDRACTRSDEHDAAEWVTAAGAVERLQFDTLHQLIRAVDHWLASPDPAPALRRSLTRCPRCGMRDAEPWLALQRDYGVLYGLMGLDPAAAPTLEDRYVRCPSDGRIRLEQQLEDDLWHAFTFAPLVDAKHDRDRAALEAVAAHDVDVMEAANHTGGKRWLEVGSGYGYTVAQARLRGYDAEGIDLAPAKLAWCAAHLDVPAAKLHVGDPMGIALEPASYDVVWSMHVIEHVPDPTRFLARIREWLTPGGRVLLATPNAASWKARRQGSEWGYATPFGHLWLFDWATLTQACADAGLEVVRRVNRIAVEGPLVRLGKRVVAAACPDAISELCLIAQRPK